MAALRTLLWLLFTVAPALSLPAWAQMQAGSTRSGPATWQFWATRSYLGLSLGRFQYSIPCGRIAFLCDDTGRSAQLYTARMIGNFWGIELGYLDPGSQARLGGEALTQGLNLSVIGKTSLSHSVGVFGKLGTTYARAEVVGSGISIAAEQQAFGLAYGAGMSFDFTPQLSATVEWAHNDLRFLGSGREPVRSTSLGLQYRY